MKRVGEGVSLEGKQAGRIESCLIIKRIVIREDNKEKIFEVCKDESKKNHFPFSFLFNPNRRTMMSFTAPSRHHLHRRYPRDLPLLLLEVASCRR